MSRRTGIEKKRPFIIGAGLIVLDIILNNGDGKPIFRAGGTCGNVLAGLSYLGWKSAAISRIGTDSAGQLMANDLSGSGVDISCVRREEVLKTPRIIEKLSSNGIHPKHAFLLRCSACHTYLPRFRSPTLDVVDSITSDTIAPTIFFFDRVSPAILKLAKVYRERGALIFFEPNSLKNTKDIERAVTLCHVLKYSGEETKERTPDEADHYLQKFDPPLIIKTLGKEGLMFSSSKSKTWHYQRGIFSDRLKDTCGAGDWCTVGFLYFLNAFAAERNIGTTEALKSYQLINCTLRHAQIISSLSCGFIGARGLSDAADRSSLMRSIDHCITNRTDINSALGALRPKRILPLRINKKRIDAVACPVCLLA